MVFISHSSKDKSFVEALVDLLEGLGLTKNNLFCSSVDGYGIPLGRDIFETISIASIGIVLGFCTQAKQHHRTQ